MRIFAKGLRRLGFNSELVDVRERRVLTSDRDLQGNMGI
jgi:hypothetical protein